MGSGLVVVAARTGGTPEIIADGDNGLLFLPKDPEDLAKKIAHLANDPQSRKQIAHAGRQTILKRFTMTKMMDEIESYLQEVASHSTTKINRHLETNRNPNQLDKHTGFPTVHN
jgi:glycosyltransferase involved in cell wall biosynthesis